jgi:hypothetical protein
MISAYFLEVEKISKDIFSVLSLNNIYFSYFCADEKYYLFLYSQVIQDFLFLNKFNHKLLTKNSKLMHSKVYNK